MKPATQASAALALNEGNLVGVSVLKNMLIVGPGQVLRALSFSKFTEFTERNYTPGLSNYRTTNTLSMQGRNSSCGD